MQYTNIQCEELFRKHVHVTANLTNTENDNDNEFGTYVFKCLCLGLLSALWAS